MPRAPIATYPFALVVVRLGHRFLLVQERKYGESWYLPAGRVEPGETFIDAAKRETLEETGVPIVLSGIIRVQHTPNFDGTARLRVFFLAHPKDDTPPKQIADEESLRAAFIGIDELHNYTLRGEEVREILTYVDRGGPVYPMSLLQTEGAPWL